MPVTPEDLADALDTTQACQALNVSQSTLRRMISRREIEHVRVGSGRGTIRITRRAITEYLSARAERTAVR